MPWATTNRSPQDLHRQEHSQADPNPDWGSPFSDDRPQGAGAWSMYASRIIPDSAKNVLAVGGNAEAGLEEDEEARDVDA